ncbi:single-stranded-DNA-specific exonuclease RecJ [Clostridium sp. D2Q-11]|uniref:Single-stranded-DNA-specific exonuclease RecJ n=1 Tax=Anaeromonas frigoriresistens TaxID=2683708 RepID=A0A942UZJ4_9FIRM|nr:single-stranded-DNA-specific exonuclease RecJ [Anaeromonas frigoriresistens]MBS4539689.1 single-stranded-DNA-specific exonuclease RecJ [Anaeromonas frigoriresistens]
MRKNDEKFLKVLQQEKSDIQRISQELKISPLVSRVLFNRGIKDNQEIIKFLDPDYNYFYDPYLLNDMGKATDRILEAIELDNTIWIYGDYDVDGVTSTSLLVTFLSQIGIEVRYYIPDRHTEGYGVNKDAIKYIYENKGDLIITVDCGITSVEEVEYCNELGMDIIITDHHTCGDILPNAIAVINPNREDSNYPFKKLAGVGVAFKLVQSISKALKIDIDYSLLLPIVAIGTVADVVSLMDENRLIVKKGLELIKETPNLGIQALLEVTGLKDKDITSGHIGFVIGPRINAAGRMNYATKGVELFTSDDYEKALNIARELDEENKNRQLVEGKILEDAEEIIKKRNLEKDNVIVLASNNWHHGVIGIVSSRITEKYHRPSVLISIDENKEGRGSARSISTLNIYDALKNSKDLFLGFGGHKQAAGLSIKEENIEIFREKINTWVDKELEEEDFCQEIVIDSTVEVDDISLNTVNELKKLAPFGMGNSSPIFLFEDAIVTNIKGVGKDKTHLKMEILYKGIQIDGIGFNLGYYVDDICNTDLINIIGSLDINEYMGNKKVQIMIKDIIKPKIEYDIENRYYNSLNDVFSKGYKLYSKDFNFNNLDNKLNYLIKKLKSDKNIKVYINNLINLKNILNAMNREGRDIFKNTSFGYSEEQKIRKNIIIINPTNESILKEKYDEVILYDLPFIEEIYYTIRTVHDNVEILCEENDLNYNKEMISEWTPNIEELRNIYKSFLTNKSFKLNMIKYIDSLRSRNININVVKLQLSLDIFKETGLLDYKKLDNNNYYIKINKVSSKVNISDAPLLKSLNNYIL